MKKKLFSCAAVALLSLVSLPAFADCVCGTTGCEPCDSTEDYLEDVGEHIKKQSHWLTKKARKQKMHKSSVCPASSPAFWAEEAVMLDKNGDIILYYADLVDDNAFSLTPAQQSKANTDAKALKEAGQKIKDKAMSEKENCMQTTEVVEEVVQTIPKGKKHGKKQQPNMVWLDAMEQNGNMLIEVGEFIETNMGK